MFQFKNACRTCGVELIYRIFKNRDYIRAQARGFCCPEHEKMHDLMRAYREKTNGHAHTA